MSQFEINADWIEADDVVGPELAATWCSLSITVDGDPVTRVFTHRSRTVRENVVVAAYPLAEWIATSWWRLFEERENPLRLGRRAFREAHLLIHARDGYALPNLQLICLGETCRLDWRAARIASCGVEFLASGIAHVGTETVRSVFFDFINQVVSRLMERGVEETLLQYEWSALNALDSEERKFCRAIAAVGLDPFAVSEEVANAIITAYDLLSDDLVKELSAVVEGEAIHLVAGRVRDLLLELQQSHNRLRSIATLKESMASRDGSADLANLPPWRLGYSDARALRAELELDGQPIGSIERLIELLGESNEVLRDLTCDFDLSMVDGLLSIDDSGALAVKLAASRPEALLFHFGRAIGSYLYQRAPASALTKAISDHQSRSRAFAAELLVPSYALTEEVGDQLVDQEQVEDIAARYGVSPYVVHYQLLNHRIAEPPLAIEDSRPMPKWLL